MGDSWGELAVPYLLPKYVFVRRGYAGWAGLDRDALQSKCRPYLAPSCAKTGSGSRSLTSVRAQATVAA